MKIKVGIIGAGYTSIELVRLLQNHPNAEVVAISSLGMDGKDFAEEYSQVFNLLNLNGVGEDEAIAVSDVIFAALPHGVSQSIAKKVVEAGKKFIDLGADFRLKSEDCYRKWYEGDFLDHDLQGEAVYALPELFRHLYNADTRILANPGCYPTASSLAIYPALKRGLVENDTIIIDAKSGITGAGRTPTLITHFPECNEGLTPYAVTAHRHTPEIEQTLNTAHNERPVKVIFTPHLIPMNRGVLTTCYTRLKLGVTIEKVFEIYNDFYQNEPFVRVLEQGKTASTTQVRGSNICNISIHLDINTGGLILIGAIDNMIKGASGQAIQNMNILFGLPETAGLELIPTAF